MQTKDDIGIDMITQTSGGGIGIDRIMELGPARSHSG
jgi:hypothetical protein